MEIELKETKDRDTNFKKMHETMIGILSSKTEEQKQVSPPL